MISELIKNLDNELFGDNIGYYYFSPLTISLNDIYSWFQGNFAMPDAGIFAILNFVLLLTVANGPPPKFIQQTFF